MPTIDTRTGSVTDQYGLRIRPPRYGDPKTNDSLEERRRKVRELFRRRPWQNVETSYPDRIRRDAQEVLRGCRSLLGCDAHQSFWEVFKRTAEWIEECEFSGSDLRDIVNDVYKPIVQMVFLMAQDVVKASEGGPASKVDALLEVHRELFHPRERAMLNEAVDQMRETLKEVREFMDDRDEWVDTIRHALNELAPAEMVPGYACLDLGDLRPRERSRSKRNFDARLTSEQLGKIRNFLAQATTSQSEAHLGEAARVLGIQVTPDDPWASVVGQIRQALTVRRTVDASLSRECLGLLTAVSRRLRGGR